jgi:hypothetical protein
MLQKHRVAFVLLLFTALVSAACGRQVTPNPPGLGPGGAPLGYMAVFFNTQGPFNFSTYQYMVVLNTTGSGVTPSTDTLQTNWAGYSYAMVARGNGVSSFAQAVQFTRSNQNPHIPPVWLQLGTTPQQFSYNLNDNGTGTEFSILAQKPIFNSSPSPGPSPTATPPNIWTFNAFVTSANGSGVWRFVDSMGAGGPVDPQWVSPKLCMSEPFDNTYQALDVTGISDPAAEITSIEIANNPPSPAPC